jgi:hypothetical protein
MRARARTLAADLHPRAAVAARAAAAGAGDRRCRTDQMLGRAPFRDLATRAPARGVDLALVRCGGRASTSSMTSRRFICQPNASGGRRRPRLNTNGSSRRAVADRIPWAAPAP